MARFGTGHALERFAARTGLQSNRLSRGELFAYSLAESPMHMVSLPVGVFLPAFYAQDLGLGLTAVGMILMVARLWDVVTDPLIGYLSDRTKTRFGRRKPWILVSIPLVMLSVYHLFLPGETVSNTYLLAWVMLLWLGWTLFNIPYYAWGAELSPDYTERTRITGWRTMLGVGGGTVAVLLPAGSQMFLGYGGSSGEALDLIANVVVWLMPVCAVVLLVVVRERHNFVPPKIDILPGLKVMWANPPFRRLLFAYLACTTGSALCSPLVVLFFDHVIGNPTVTPLVLMGYFVASLVGIPLWVWLAKKTDKHLTWLIALSLLALIFPCFMFVGEGDVWLGAGLMFMVGIASNFAVVPVSMKADVIDLDQLQSGEHRAGLFFAAWSTATKLAMALGVGIAMPALDFLGFDPKITNPPEQLFALRAWFSFAPIAFYAAAAVLLLGYPITRSRHREIQAQLSRGSIQLRRQI